MSLRSLSGRRLLGLALGVLLFAGGILAFLSGRQKAASEREREAPVASPSRLHNVRSATGDEAAIVLDARGSDRAGIRTLVLGAATRQAGEIRLTGELIADPGRISTIRAAIAGRIDSIGGRWPELGDALTAGRAVAQVSDAKPLVAPRSGVVTRVSAQPGELVQAGQELFQLTDFGEPLARIAWRLDLSVSPPATLAIAPLEEPSARVIARYVAAGPEVDVLTRAPAYLYRLTHAWPGARPGLPVVATVPDQRTAARGVLAPTEAVVQWRGLAWAYVQHTHKAQATGSEERWYVRVRVETSHPVDGGWLVTGTPGGLGTGDTVVVRGAQQLLSEEFRAHSAAGDDAGQH